MNKGSRLNTIEEAVEDIRNGKVVIVCDDEDRENEGDFIASAELITPEVVNFMATVGRGLICAAITPERASQLALKPMVSDNTSLHATNFTVSIDLKGYGCATGISAQDRAKTLNALTNNNIKPEELGKPGHIFPIVAHPDGLKSRPGHTEAAVELPRLAGLFPAGVLVEIMNEDGTMARFPELVEMSRQRNIKIITVKQLIEYLYS